MGRPGIYHVGHIHCHTFGGDHEAQELDLCSMEQRLLRFEMEVELQKMSQNSLYAP